MDALMAELVAGLRLRTDELAGRLEPALREAEGYLAAEEAEMAAFREIVEWSLGREHEGFLAYVAQRRTRLESVVLDLREAVAEPGRARAMAEQALRGCESLEWLHEAYASELLLVPA